MYENIPEISDRAARLTHSRETNLAESLCFPGVPAAPYLMCMTQAEYSLDRVRRACTASAFLPASEYFCEVPHDFLPWVRPNTGGSSPMRPRDLLRTHSHSASRWRLLRPGEPSPGGSRSARHNRT